MRKRRVSLPSVLPEAGVDGIDAPIEFRRHPGARRLTLRVSRTRRAVVVTLPVQCDLGEAGSLIHRNIDWVRERLGKLPQPVPFQHGALLPVRGIVHRLAFGRPGLGVPNGVWPRSHETGHEIEVVSRLDRAPARFREWIFDEARRDLEERVAFHANAMRVRAVKIAVRDQTSRWGSCSTTGVLSFSWRLIMAPPFVLDYVAAHEVAHLAEMNHGPRFWALVRQAIPRMDEAQDWLRTYGMDLHRYGPAVRRAS